MHDVGELCTSTRVLRFSRVGLQIFMGTNMHACMHPITHIADNKNKYLLCACAHVSVYLHIFTYVYIYIAGPPPAVAQTSLQLQLAPVSRRAAVPRTAALTDLSYAGMLDYERKIRCETLPVVIPDHAGIFWTTIIIILVAKREERNLWLRCAFWKFLCLQTVVVCTHGHFERTVSPENTNTMWMTLIMLLCLVAMMALSWY